MQRSAFFRSFSFLSLALGLSVTQTVHAQNHFGAALGGFRVAQAPPGGGLPPPAGGGGGGGVVPPDGMPPPIGGGGGGGVIPPGFIPPGAGGGGGGVLPPAVGNLTIGAIPITPPPIGYYAPARPANYNLGKFYYYPYYYFPHNYWPTQSCPWPERPGEPYMRPPAYMAYPPFLEPHWRYEWYTPQKYYRGFHFWLDQF